MEILHSPAWGHLIRAAESMVRLPPSLEWRVCRDILKEHPGGKLFRSCKFVGRRVSRVARRTIDRVCEVLPGRLCVLASNEMPSVEFLRQAVFLMEFVRLLSGRRESPAVVLIMLDIPKVAPRTRGKNVACPDKVNSGACFNRKAILVWRKEEMLKVLIHELVHAYSLEEGIFDDRELMRLHENLFALSPESMRAPKEAVTEVITALITSVLHAHMTHSDPWRVWEQQTVWCLDRVALIRPLIHRDETTGAYVQSTDMLSYYVLKAGWMLMVLKGGQHLAGTFLRNTVLGTQAGPTALLRPPMRLVRAYRPSASRCGSSLRMTPPGILGDPAPSDLQDTVVSL